MWPRDVPAAERGRRALQMGRVVAIGAQDFASIRENGYFYVDKTGFIKEWWENGDAVTLVARPRRFGKTLNMSMAEQFFSNQYAGRGSLFEGLAVWEEEKYRRLQGAFPVLSLSFAGVKGRTRCKGRDHPKPDRLIWEIFFSPPRGCVKPAGTVIFYLHTRRCFRHSSSYVLVPSGNMYVPLLWEKSNYPVG